MRHVCSRLWVFTLGKAFHIFGEQSACSGSDFMRVVFQSTQTAQVFTTVTNVNFNVFCLETNSLSWECFRMEYPVQCGNWIHISL